jgi:pilus assembly protein Flp/PilA
MFARLRKSEDGATMIEYSILIGIITAAAIASIITMGGYVQTQWADLVSDTSATGGGTGGGTGGTGGG